MEFLPSSPGDSLPDLSAEGSDGGEPPDGGAAAAAPGAAAAAPGAAAAAGGLGAPPLPSLLG